ncbi:MAG: hypothetical protein ACO2PN_19960 [Pyrobaculum sp.]|jgi:hypothetical protein
MKTQNNVAAGAAGAGGNPARQRNRVPASEIYNVRSYMFEELETKEVLHIDRIDNPWAVDIARTLEKLAMGIPATVPMLISDDYVMMKVTDRWKVGISRDGAVIIKVSDCVLIADDKFLLLCMGEDGRYAPIVKGETITWDGTEEYFEPADIRRLIKDVLRRILERVRWL